MAVTVSVNGVDLTALHQRKGFAIKNSGHAGILTASCQFIDIAGTAAINLEHTLRILDGATEIFEGPIRKRGRRAAIDPAPSAGNKKTYRVSAQDFTSLLADDVIDASLVRTGTRTDKAEVEFILTTYGSKGITGGSTVINTGNITRDIDYSGMNLYEALEEAGKWMGIDFYVDTNKALHWFETESNAAPFNLSDNPNLSTTFGYRDLDLDDDSSELVNAVWVVGTDITGWVEDATSIGIYGRREGTLRDTNITTTTERDAAGQEVLLAKAYPEGPITLSTFTAGLRAGMTVQVTNALWGISAVTYRILEVNVKYHGNTEQLIYDLTLNSRPLNMSDIINGTEKGIITAQTSIGGQVDAAIADLSVGGGNLVPNSSFEDGSQWTVGSNWVINFDPTSPQEPFQGAKVARAALSAQTAGSLETPFIPVARTDDYYFSAWRFIRSYTSGTLRMHVLEYDAASALLATTTQTAAAADTAYTRHVFHFGPNAEIGRTAFHANTVKVRIRFDTAGSSTLTADFDGVQAERGGLLTAYAPAPYELYAGAIGSTQIADDAITTPKIAANAVVAGKVAADTIAAAQIQAGAVTTNKLLAGTITLYGPNGETILDPVGFGPTWERGIDGGLFNGDFVASPATPANNINNSTNPLPKWSFVQSSGTAITAKWFTSALTGSGGVVEFAMVAGAAGDYSYLEQVVPVLASENRAYSFSPYAYVRSGTGAIGTDWELILAFQYLKKDGTPIGSERVEVFSSVGEIGAKVGGSTQPASTAYSMRFRIGMRRKSGASTSATGAMVLAETSIIVGQPRIHIPEITDPTNYDRGTIQQNNGQINIIPDSLNDNNDARGVGILYPSVLRVGGGGSSFPTNPADGDLYYRDDQKTWYRWWSSPGAWVNVGHAGWQGGAFPLAYYVGAALNTSASLNAVTGGLGGARAVPMVVQAPMLLRSYAYYNMDGASTRSAEFRLYEDVGQQSLRFISGTDATASFTAAGNARRSVNISAQPTFLRPGIYYLVVRNTSTAQTFSLGFTAAGDVKDPTLNMSNSGIAALGSTLDITGWTESSALFGLQMWGETMNAQTFWGWA